MARYLIFLHKTEEEKVVSDMEIREMEFSFRKTTPHDTPDWTVIDKLKPVKLFYRYSFIRIKGGCLHRFFMEFGELDFQLTLENVMEKAIPEPALDSYLVGSTKEIVEYLKLEEGTEFEFHRLFRNEMK